MVTLGRVLGPWGVKGWIKVYSYTNPRENIVRYAAWTLRRGTETRAVMLEDGRRQGKDVVAKLEAVDDRDAAEALAGAEIVVERRALVPCAEDEFYWADIEGLHVRTAQGEELGRVVSLFGTGSNDVMVVVGEREHLVPFIVGTVVREVRLAEHLIVVDWDPDF